MKMRTNYFTSKGKALLRSLLLFVSVFAAQMVSAQEYSSGNLKYYIYPSDGYAQVSGLSGVGLLATSITIPATITYNGTTYPVTRVAGSAFANKTSLQKVIYRTTNLKTIGAGAFSGCTNLSMFASGDRPENENRILIIDGITSIGVGAFDNCPMLTELVIRNGNNNKTLTDAFVTNSNITSAKIYGAVPMNMFTNCTSLQSVSILNPDYTPALESFSVGYEAFKGCTNLKSVTFDSKISDISTSAFEGTGLSSVSIPANEVGERAFYGCKSLTSAIINSSKIKESAFRECTSLNNITLNNTEYIQASAFWNAPLTKVVLPECVKTIGQYAFYCPNAEYSLVVLPQELSGFIGSLWFNNTSKINMLVVNSVTCLKRSDFIQEVVGTKHIKRIEIGSTEVGESWCKGLAELQEVIFDKTNVTIGDDAFSGCTGLTSLNITASSIGKNAFFGCTGIKNANIVSPTIESFAFARCTSMQTLTVKASTKLGFGAFAGCSALTSTSITSLPLNSAPCFQGCGGKVYVETTTPGVSSYSSAASPFYGSDFSEATTSCYAKGLFTGCTKLEALYLKNPKSTWTSAIMCDCPNVVAAVILDPSESFRNESLCTWYVTSLSKSLLVIPSAKKSLVLKEDGLRYTFPAGSLSQYRGLIDATKITQVPSFGDSHYDATVLCTPSMADQFKRYFDEDKVIVRTATGDVNADGRVSVADVTSLVDILQKQ